MFGFNEEGPMSTMDEDVKLLGISHLFESAGDAPMAGSAPAKKAPAKGATGAPSGDAAAPRTEITPRQEAAGEDDYGATKATPPKDDGEKKDGEKEGGDKPNPFAKKDGDDKGGDKDEKGDKPNPFAKKDDDGDEDDEMGEALEAILNMSEQDVDGLSEEEADGILHALVAVEDIVENGSPKLEAAYFVLDAFYGQLAEGETDSIDKPTLVGVVEAFEHVLADLGLLDEWKGGMGKAVSRHGIRAMAHGKMPHAASMTHQKKVSEIKVKMGKAHSFKKGLHSFKPPAMKHGKHGKGGMGYGKKHEDEQTGEQAPIKDLVASLAALKEAVTTGRVVNEASNELIEGFNSIGATATTWYEGIAKEVKAALAEGKADENDARIAIGRHLCGIAEDAAEQAEAISTGQFIAENAENNLRCLAADLDDVVEAMKSVE